MTLTLKLDLRVVKSKYTGKNQFRSQVIMSGRTHTRERALYRTIGEVGNDYRISCET